MVRCGEWDSSTNSETKKHQDRVARHISVHPAYNNKTLYYDYALVHTKSKFDYDDSPDTHIFPICLPDPGPLPNFDEYEDPCYAMGHGKNGYGEYLKLTIQYNHK